jgi:hypothetical protein
MSVRVDDQRHDRLTFEIDDLCGRWRVRMPCGNRLNPVSVDHDGSVGLGGTSRAIDDRDVRQYNLLLCRRAATHHYRKHRKDFDSEFCNLRPEHTLKHIHWIRLDLLTNKEAGCRPKQRSTSADRAMAGIIGPLGYVEVTSRRNQVFHCLRNGRSGQCIMRESARFQKVEPGHGADKERNDRNDKRPPSNDYSRSSAGSPLLIAARTLPIRLSRSPKSEGSIGS